MNNDRRAVLGGSLMAGLAATFPALAGAQTARIDQPDLGLRQMDPNPPDPSALAMANEIQMLTTGPNPRFTEAGRYFAKDMILQTGNLPPLIGRDACLSALPTYYKDGMRYRFDVYATQVVGPAVILSRIDYVLKPGQSDRAIALVAIFTFRRGELLHWLELPAYLNEKAAHA